MTQIPRPTAQTPATPPVGAAMGPAGGSAGQQDLALRLATALESVVGPAMRATIHAGQWENLASAKLLDDTELLDAIVAYRQGQDRRFTARQIQDAVLAVLDTRQVSLWLEHPQDTTTPCGSLHPEDAGHVARWVAETLSAITEEPNV